MRTPQAPGGSGKAIFNSDTSDTSDTSDVASQNLLLKIFKDMLDMSRNVKTC